MTLYKMKNSSFLIMSMVVWMASAESYSFQCRGVGIYPDPTNCHNYYTCDNNLKASLRSCMNGTGTYNPESKICDVTQCSNSPSTFVCPGVGLYIDPANCTNFYSCNQDLKPIPGSCIGGKGSFDNVTKTCSTSSCFNCVTPGFFADPDDCHSFYICSEKLIATHSTCSSAGYFDPVHICVFGACGQGTTTEAPPFACTTVGYFADPRDCRGFYYCDKNLTAYRGLCMGGGGYFDKKENGCTVGKCSN